MPFNSSHGQSRRRDPGLNVTIVGSGWQFVSGISYYTWRLSTALHDGGHRVSVILMRNLLPKRLYPGRERVGHKISSQSYPANVRVHDGVDWWAIPSLWRAVRFLRKQDPQVVVLQWWTSTVLHSYLALVLAARAQGAKVVVEFHEVLDSAELRVPLVRSYSRALAELILARVDGAIVHSRYDLELLHSNYEMSHLRVLVAPHGPYDHLVGSHESTSQSGERGIGDGPVNLLFFGTIRPYKGLEHLIEAFNSLTPEEVQGYRLTVVGEVWEGWTLPIELIEASPYRERITLVDRYVDDDEAAEAFRQADAVILPYLRSSASGPLHLAMSHGLPVAITVVGGLVEAAGDYRGVVFIPPADPQALRAAIGELGELRGRRFSDPHSWSLTVQAVEELAAEMGIEWQRPVVRASGATAATTGTDG